MMEDFSDNEFNDENSQNRLENSDEQEEKQFTSPTPGKNISSSVQEFLKQSNEIQEEIRKLSELCQQISPKKESFVDEPVKENSEEQGVFWSQINNLLESHGFRSIALVQDEDLQEIPDFQSLSDTVVDLITEYANLYRSYTEIETSYGKLEKENQELQSLAEKSKKHENQFKDLDKINRQLQEKLNKTREKLKENNLAKSSQFKANDKAQNTFKAFIGHDFNPSKDSDSKIMGIIANYEEQKQKLLAEINNYKKEIDGLNNSFKKNREKLTAEAEYHKTASKTQKKFEIQDQESFEKLKILDTVVSQLSLKNYLEIPHALTKIQQVMLTLPGIDRFVKQICKEIMLSPSSKLEEVIETLRDIKKRLQNLENFKIMISETLLVKLEEEIIEKIKGLAYFCKLFEIKPKDQIVASVEGIFFFVHEIKMFLSVWII